MATELNGTISQRLDDKKDRFFDNVALANAGTITSDYRRCAKANSRVEIVVVADTEITNTGNIVVSLTASSTPTGSYTEFASFTIGAGTQAEGSELVRHTPNTDVPHYVKVTITTAEDLQSDKVTATMNYTA